MIIGTSIGKLAAALASAQAEIGHAAKDSVNPHFRSRYADLASVWDACRAPLAKAGLAVIQTVAAQGSTVTITTVLAHSSGEYVASDLTLTAAQNTPQGVGSAITYGRRYALAAIVGVASAEDDGEAASGRGENGQAPAPPPAPSAESLKPTLVERAPVRAQQQPATISEAQIKRLFALCKQHNVEHEALKEHIGHLGYEHTNEIRRTTDYDAICRWIETGVATEA